MAGLTESSAETFSDAVASVVLERLTYRVPQPDLETVVAVVGGDRQAVRDRLDGAAAWTVADLAHLAVYLDTTVSRIVRDAEKVLALM